MGHLIGVDVGTSGTKAVLCDERGRVRAQVVAEYPCHAPRPGWSEQAPADWWRAVVGSVRKMLRDADIPGRDVGGIGLSGQMHGLVCLDGQGRVLRPAILWNDQRTARECEEITERAGGRGRLIRYVANPALTGFTAPKILWVRRHEPRVYARTRMMLLPKDYIRYRMTGEYATEVSDASGTLLLDVARRRWRQPLLSRLEIDPERLPRVYESPEVSGRVSREAARRLGVPAGTSVVGGGGDQAAGAVGNGIVRRGVVSATLGTSGVVFAHAESMETDPQGRVHTFCHAVPGKWHVMGVVLAAGGSFQWFRNVLAQDVVAEATRRGRDPYDLITRGAARVPAGCEGLMFLPYLTGERTPHADPYARACFIGLTPRSDRDHMARAVMEGATFAMKDCLEIIRGLGVRPREVRLAGGGARSKLWAQMQADVYACDCAITNSSVGPAYGAMLLAGVGTGVWKSVPEACAATIRVRRRVRKTREGVRAYRKWYRVYRSLYPALKDAFGEIGTLATEA